MSKPVLVAGLALFLALTNVTSTWADPLPVGRCPDQFELHLAADHDDHHSHHHAGTDTDRNGDGWICVKHVGADDQIHVHTDNNAALQ